MCRGSQCVAGCWQYVGGLDDASRAVLFVASSRNVVVMGEGCCLHVRGGGHMRSVVPPPPGASRCLALPGG